MTISCKLSPFLNKKTETDVQQLKSWESKQIAQCCSFVNANMECLNVSFIDAQKLDKKTLTMYHSLYQSIHKHQKSDTKINQDFFDLFFIRRNWAKNCDSLESIQEMRECIDFLFDLIEMNIGERSLILESFLMRCTKYPHLMDTLFLINMIQWDDSIFFKLACSNLFDNRCSLQRLMFLSYLRTQNGTKFDESFDPSFVVERYELIQRHPEHSIDSLELIVENFPKFFSSSSTLSLN